MIDETTDVATLQQFITFVRYVKDGKIKNAFLDIRRLDSAGATADNLLKCFKTVCADYNLDLTNHVAIACDEAASMIGRNNGMATQLQRELGSMTTVHCYAHRLALACADTVADLSGILTTLQTYKYFSQSPLRTSKLADTQGMIGSAKKKLQRACKTRWLSHDKSVTAIKSEMVPIWVVLENFAAKNDATATGLLGKIKTPTFVGTIAVLSTVLPHLTRLSKTGDLHYAHIQSSIDFCKQSITKISEDDEPLKDLQKEWPTKFAELLDIAEIPEPTQTSITKLTSQYTKALLSNIDERFPEPELLSSFSIFDPQSVPKDRVARRSHGQEQLDILLDRFGSHLVGEDATELDKEKVKLDYDLLKDRMAGQELGMCKSVVELCSKLVTDNFYKQMSPELSNLAKISLCIPMSTAWPERGFSALRRIKNRMRSRLLDPTVSALLNISINGPEELSDEDAMEIARQWKAKKKRRNVFERKLKEIKESELTVGEEDSEPDFEGFEEDSDFAEEIEQFWL